MAKRCTRCLQWKDNSEFYRDRTKLDGLKSQCKDCRKLYKREYRSRLRARAMAHLRRTYMRVWLARRVPQPLALSPGFVRWQEKRRDRRRELISAHLRRWHIAHPEASRTWYADTPEMPTARRQNLRARQAGAAVSDFSPEEWKWLVKAYGHRCAYCGRPDDRLTPDHIVPLAQGGRNTLSNIVPACMTCNSQKGARTPSESGMSFAVQVDVARQLEQIAFL